MGDCGWEVVSWDSWAQSATFPTLHHTLHALGMGHVFTSLVDIQRFRCSPAAL